MGTLQSSVDTALTQDVTPDASAGILCQEDL
jgi:hypothetical protein